MEKIQFKCELLSDIVLNDSPATEGKRKCIDFISGNNFLGIVASQLYGETDETSWLIFHSGNVRFGDAKSDKTKCDALIKRNVIFSCKTKCNKISTFLRKSLFYMVQKRLKNLLF